ncbi:hypothetical protein [Dyadobacter sp. SG02]|uniref:hypothetical protein n=1 Tax=Dyadobacter sp. SG02 TaxID=1855291 RepID=UPI000B8A2C11|nr:hypothetical protein [Dyadobacter sp. SG02]
MFNKENEEKNALLPAALHQPKGKGINARKSRWLHLSVSENRKAAIMPEAFGGFKQSLNTRATYLAARLPSLFVKFVIIS